MTPIDRFTRWEIRLRLALRLTVLLGCSACQAEQPRPIPVSFVVAQADNTPVEGARVRVGERAALSDAAGRVDLLVRGEPDTLTAVQLSCPAGFTSAGGAPRVALRSSQSLGAAQGSGVVHALGCTPLTTRRVVVVTTNVPMELPILVDGRRVASTEGGVAHVAYEGPPRSSFSVVLDTSQYPDLLPRNPSREMRTAELDEVSVFEQDFSRVRRKPRRKARPKKRKAPRPVALR